MMAEFTLDHLLVQQFKQEVHDRAKEIDPDNQEDWHSLVLGWAIGKGLGPEEAHEFSLYIRYDTKLG